MDKNINLGDYCSPALVAEKLSVTPARIIQLINEGKIKAEKISNKVWLVEKRSAVEYIAAVKKVRG